MAQVCNVFISHVHEDDAELKALKELVASKGCNIRDSSTDKSKPNEAGRTTITLSQILAPA
ncbi:MAG: hypothetical protein R3D01_13060 [Hyphomicrobiales bacterium]